MPSKKVKKQILLLLPFALFYVLLTFLVSDHPFFWDTIQLGSEHAHWYYENDFDFFWLPNQFDSGHFPVFGMYLAICWTLFGKSLAVSHWVMLPFLIGIVWQAHLLLKKYITPNILFFALILFLSDTVLLTQSTLISPDIPLVFFFLLALNAIIKRQRWVQTIALIALAVVSMRGMMLTAALFVIGLLNEDTGFSVKNIGFSCRKNIVYFLPAAIITTMFLGGHYIEKGWIGYHEASPWATCFEKVDFAGFIKNIAVLGFRLIDSGRLFIWIALLYIIFIKRKSLLSLFSKTENGYPSPLLMAVVIALFTTPAMLIHKYLVSHRYLLPLSLMVALSTFHFITLHINSTKTRHRTMALLLIGMLSGNFWIYPPPIAIGWDSTLAHLPYHSMRDEMMDYIETNNIDFKDVGSYFPNRAKIKYTHLNDDMRSFSSFNLGENKYIFYSNIFNDFTGEQIKILAKLKAVKITMRGQIKMVLYER